LNNIFNNFGYGYYGSLDRISDEYYEFLKNLKYKYNYIDGKKGKFIGAYSEVIRFM
jgi:hypothetical protein